MKKRIFFVFSWFIFSMPAVANVLTAGSGHSCAIQPDNRVICWGNPWSIKAPSDEFIDVSAGRSYTCGVLSDKTVSCWGSSSDGQATPPSGEFTQVSAALYNTCGIRTDETVACWGHNPDEDYGQANPPEGTFVQISAGGWHTCGVKTDGMAACWGYNENPFSKSVIGEGQATPPAGVAFTQVSAGLGGWHTCGIRADNKHVQCWGLDGDGQASPAKGEFTQISAGKYFTCGVRTDHTLACWGWSDYGQIHIPDGDCVHLSEDWPRYECTTSEEDDHYIFVTAGLIHTCAIKVDYSVSCWGKNDKNQASPPMNLIVKSLDESEPESELILTVELNQSSYQRGESFVFKLNAEGGTIDQQYDLYAALVLPSNNFLTIGNAMDLSELDQIQPYQTAVNLFEQQTFPILTLEIPNEVTTGHYQACGVITFTDIDENDEKNWLNFTCKTLLLE